MGFWERGFSDCWKDFQYYDLIEQTMRCGFDYRYLLVFDENDRPIALQPLLLANQDLAISAGARIARLVAKLRMHWPHFLKSRVALAGCWGTGNWAPWNRMKPRLRSSPKPSKSMPAALGLDW